MKPRIPVHFTFSHHAQIRLHGRGMSVRSVEAALRWGRRVRSHGDWLYRLDRRSVAQARKHGVRVDSHEGTNVILTRDHVIRTIWRNRSPQRIRQ